MDQVDQILSRLYGLLNTLAFLLMLLPGILAVFMGVCWWYFRPPIRKGPDLRRRRR